VWLLVGRRWEARLEALGREPCSWGRPQVWRETLGLGGVTQLQNSGQLA
jgi:hypothetical protein